MQETTVSVDEAARRFVEILAEARSEQCTILITENDRAIAQLSPIGAPARTCAELAGRIRGRTRLSAESVETWQSEIGEARKALARPDSKWD
jgi:antitoxin (DNA-binding transcriptional repressor) of toxin-antitoxin stability system